MSEKPRVLALYYSQTCRTKDVVEHFLRPLRDNPNVEVDEVRIEPRVPYPYPWSALSVLATFPEVVLEEPIDLNPIPIDETRKYDLVVLGCQVWFLSCSLPLLGFFHSRASGVLAQTPVLPVLTFRRAWAQGLHCIEEHIKKLGGKLVGKIVIRAQDKSTFPLLGALRNEKKPDDGKEYQFSQGEMERVGRLGKQVAAALAENPTAIFATPADDSAVVLPPRRPRDEMPVEERLIEDYEEIQKQRYLWFARIIRKLSRPKTALRYLFIILFAPFYVPPIYFKIPFLIVGRLVSTKVSALMGRQQQGNLNRN